MTDLTKKVEALERQLAKLSNVFDHIQKSLTKHPKRRSSAPTKNPGGRPEWVEDIFQHFNKISTELKSVKEALDTRSFTESRHSPSDALATNVRAEVGLLHTAPPPAERKQLSPANLEGGQRESVAANVPERVNRPLNAPAQELAPEVQVPVTCEISLTPSNSIAPPKLTAQSNSPLLDPLLDNGNAPTFCCNYKDISGNLNEARLELFSSDPRVRAKGYFKLVV
jgi:hypothetical protein